MSQQTAAAPDLAVWVHRFTQLCAALQALDRAMAEAGQPPFTVREVTLAAKFVVQGRE